MLNFASHELGEWRENSNFDFGSTAAPTKSNRTKSSAPVKILADKIRPPQADGAEASAVVRRPRLFAHLEKSLAHFSATLVTGRTGTGKTALAAEFARRGTTANGEKFDAVAWYKAETTDCDWTVFLSYFAESLQSCKSDSGATDARETAAKIDGSQSVTDALAVQFAALDAEKPLLIVLDDLHSVFDCRWFAEFFNALLGLPAPNVRLLLLARSQPAFPLWRLRSKHALDVLDEKLLAFTPDETIEFFKNYKLSQKAARFAHKNSYGRIAKLKEIAEKR